MKNQKKNNGIISFWKFVFALVIAFFHGSQFYETSKNPFFYGGYIAVEFFFIVSGFYFAKSVLKETYEKKSIGKETFQFIWKKIKALYPYILVGYILSLIIQTYYSGWGFNRILNSLWNFLLLKPFGFNNVTMLGQLWYVSYMLFAMLVMYPLLKKYNENFIYILSPVLAIVGIGFLVHDYSSINHLDRIWFGMISTGLIRAFAELNIGMIIYLIHQKLSHVEYTKFAKILFTIIGEAMLVMVVCAVTLLKKPSQFDLIMLLMISVAILIMVSEKTYDFNLMSNKFFAYLGKLSFPIFVNHTFFVSCFYYLPYLKGFAPVEKSLMMVTSSVIFSITELFFIEKIKKVGFGNKIKSLIVKSDNR